MSANKPPEDNGEQAGDNLEKAISPEREIIPPDLAADLESIPEDVRP